MKLFIDVESLIVILQSIEEILDFKGYIRNYIASKDKIIVGHFKDEQFKFYKHYNRWLLMQYKMLCSDSELLLSTNGGIKLWTEDVNTRKLLLPTGEMKHWLHFS